MRNVNQILEGKAGRLVAVPQEAPVLEVIRLMAEHHIGSVLVMQGHDLVGIATERDYARKVILQGRSSADTPVAQIMSSPVVTVLPTDTAQTCMQLMTARKIRHLPVVEDGRVLGLVSIGDLVKAVIEDQQQEIAQLQQYIAS
ncbi:CBS domain-containing protein [Arenimonas terrae]|jgi:CBS domain-containing protein|uniref:CBS domain-containing protein n=1 Tax=Arenimonas terrae TaxID=2546226 RepID=A0A5C4RW33_9GAMM|nr:CBS domain-containing protein [Arenimonas terrae]TNJ35380.1 CBS domain-containing protein [Arenimonas terrae]